MNCYTSLPQLAAVFVVVQCHQNTPPIGAGAQKQGHHHGGGGHAHGKFGTAEEIKNAEHIKSHLEGDIEFDERNMTDEQLQFYYFKMYDLNEDNALDGLEMIKAITHMHSEHEDSDPSKSTGDHGNPTEESSLKLDDQELESIVDGILRDADLNGDGYCEFHEFMRAKAAEDARAHAQH